MRLRVAITIWIVYVERTAMLFETPPGPGAGFRGDEPVSTGISEQAEVAGEGSQVRSTGGRFP